MDHLGYALRASQSGQLEGHGRLPDLPSPHGALRGHRLTGFGTTGSGGAGSRAEDPFLRGKVSLVKHLTDLLYWVGDNPGLAILYWLAVGYALTYVQRFVARCPCRMNGDEVERDHFWKIFIAGFLAVIPVVVSVLLTSSEMVRRAAHAWTSHRVRSRERLLAEKIAREVEQSGTPYIY